MAENKAKKLNIKIMNGYNETIELSDGVLNVAYSSKLNIVTINGILNNNNYKVLDKINNISKNTILDFSGKENVIECQVEESNNKEAELNLKKCRIINYCELYNKKGFTTFHLLIRGYSVEKMPEIKFNIKRYFWDYPFSILSVISGIDLCIGAGILEITSLGSMSPVAGVTIVVGFTTVAKNLNDLSEMVTNDFIMPNGMGDGDEGNFIKSTFENFSEENGEKYYNNFLMGFAVVTIAYDIKSVKTAYKQGNFLKKEEEIAIKRENVIENVNGINKKIKVDKEINIENEVVNMNKSKYINTEKKKVGWFRKVRTETYRVKNKNHQNIYIKKTARDWGGACWNVESLGMLGNDSYCTYTLFESNISNEE